MIEKIRCDSLEVIKNVLKHLKKEDYLVVREASDNLIHCASIYQDPDSISLSVSIYGLSKMIEREKKINPRIVEVFEKIHVALEKRNNSVYSRLIKQLLLLISKVDDKVGKYIRRVINDAQIRKGFKIYEHGVSAGKTAELLGISQWELMKYIGKVRIPERYKDKIPLENRLSFVRELFGLKQ